MSIGDIISVILARAKILNKMIFLIALILIIFASIFAVISSRNSDESTEEVSGFDIEIIE